MNTQDLAAAEELLRDPDYEDCERFASRYGDTLLELARQHADLLAALKHIAAIPPVTDEATGVVDDSAQYTARHAIAKAEAA